ncbi:MAG: catalase family protein [bacterium]|nr:catalase family protein [bacterium]
MLKKIAYILMGLVALLVLSIAIGQGPYVEIPADVELGKEYEFPGEAAIAEETAQLMINSIEERHKNDDLTLRDAHPFAHGCVRGSFQVQSEVPASMRHGVFAAAGSYPVWIRFSNGGVKRKPDIEGDIRGMGIKLIGVPGPKVGPEKNTQDFLVITNPVMPAGDPGEYLELFKAAIGGKPMGYFLGGMPWDWKLSAFRKVIQIRSREIPSMLSTRYWSTVPFRLGETAVKYSVRPCEGAPNAERAMPEYPGDNYLRETMVEQLGEENACFDFMVQAQVDPRLMPVEDPAVDWDEALSPFVTVAKIEIPAQTFDTPAQHRFCENLTLNPFNSLEAHRPLGALNRVRKQVYDRIAEYRLKKNAVVRTEPTGAERFE